MAGITLDQAETKLTEALAAESKILKSQRYKISDRESQRAMLSSVHAIIEYWDGKVQRLDKQGMRIRRAVPL